MADIYLESIAHSYAARPGPGDYVLHDIDLHWRDGGAYALLGPSGCGKTTLLNIMSGLVQPTRGRVRYRGKGGERDVTRLPTRQRNIAQVFQFPVIYDTMTVFDNLAFPLRNRGVSEPAVRERVEHIAGQLELTGVLGQRATGLTADTKQIISLGRGLVRDDVAAILFDEPLTVIDPHKKWKLRRKLREIHRTFQHTMIYVTHDQTEALTFADEVVVMHEGRVLQQGTPEALFTRPVHTHVGYFIGSPGMNFLPCRVEGGALVIGEREAGEVHRLPLPGPLAEAAAARAGALVLGIRPEHVRVAAGAGVAGAGPALPVAVSRVDDLGRTQIISGTLAAHRIKIETEGGVAVADGATCRVLFPPEHICLYEDDHLIVPSHGPQIVPSPGSPA
jgi:glycerol transport system ATP-binding protein